MRHSKLFASLTANAIPPGSKQEVEKPIPPGMKQEVEKQILEVTKQEVEKQEVEKQEVEKLPETVPQPAAKRVKGQAKAKAAESKPKVGPSKKRSVGRI